MGLKGIQTVPPPEKCKIFVIISPFMSCFNQQGLFQLEVKEGGGVGRGGMGEFLFLFCFLCGLQKASPDDEKSRNPACFPNPSASRDNKLSPSRLHLGFIKRVFFLENCTFAP